MKFIIGIIELDIRKLIIPTFSLYSRICTLNMSHLFLFTLTFLLFAIWYSLPKAKIALVGALICCGFLISMQFQVHGLNKESLIHLSIDFLLLGIHLLILQAFKHLPYSMFIGFCLAISITYSHKAVVAKQQAITGDIPELIIHFQDDQAKNRILKTYRENIISTEVGFSMSDKISTELDDYYVMNIPDNIDPFKLLKRLKREEGVNWVELNQKIEIPDLNKLPEVELKGDIILDDPLVDQQWSMKVLAIDKMHDKLKNRDKVSDKKVTIAILDTGIDSKHEDLKGRYRSSGVRTYDSDSKGHGTHCAGIAAAITNNKIGVSSILPDLGNISVMSIQVLNNFGFGTQQTIINGILKAADLGSDVISLSLGGLSSESKERAYTKAIEYANSKGSIVVVAAGNSSKNAKHYSPANTPGVIAVTAVDSTLQRAKFANSVDELEMGVAAPGVNILSTFPGNKYKRFNGTSMAAPFVAGMIAVLKSYNPELDTKKAYEMLTINNKQGRLSTVPVVQPNQIVDQLD